MWCLQKGVGEHSILCMECRRWVHKRCNGISGKLKNNVDFHCRERGWESHLGGWEWPLSVNFAERSCDWALCEVLNVFPSSAIWATHLVREEVWRRRQEPEWDVLGQSSRSYLLSFFSFPNYKFSRGHPLKISIPLTKLNSRKFFFASRVILAWNSLPETTVMLHPHSVSNTICTTRFLEISNFSSCYYVVTITYHNIYPTT